jgi:hypothetical protein
VRGRSEFVKVDSTDEVFKAGVALELGGIPPLSPVENVVAVLAWIVMAFEPPIDVRLKFGVGAKLGDEDAETLVEDGGIMPESPVEKVTAVLEEVENSTEPTEIDMSISRLGDGVADTVMDTSVAGGGMTPGSPVTEVVAVLPETVKFPAPPVDEEINRVSSPEVETEPVLAGGMIPESPVELEAKVLPLVAKEATQELTTVKVSTETFADGAGGMIPEPPVLIMVAVEPEIVNSKDPTEVTTEGGAVETLEFENSWTDWDASVLTSVIKVGVMIPSAPVDTAM